MLRDALLLAIRESKGVTFTDAEARDAFVDDLLNAMAEELFGEGAETGDPASPSRALSDLYENCSEWTDGACEVTALNLTGPAVELGSADWLAWEFAEGEDSRPTLGYTMPDVERFYYHQLPAETRVFVLPSGALVVTHPDLMLTAQGLDEPGQYEDEDEDEDEYADDPPDYDPL